MHNNKGFTLIELMVTISVAAIIMVIALPSMQTMRANARVLSTANELATDLKKARNEALLTRRNHTLSAVNASNANNKWGQQGWQLGSLLNADDVFKNQRVPQGVFVNSALTSLVFVASTGMVQTAAGNPVSSVFSVCDNQNTKETGYNVLINQFGRVLVQKHDSPSVCNT